MTEKQFNKYNVFRPFLVEKAEFVGKYDFPVLKATSSIATKAIPFDKANKEKDKNQWIHFYIDDYRFERIWSSPQKYLSIFKQFTGVIGPDFSVYTNMPLSMQIWNTYRNRSLSFWLQDKGIDLIPNIVWGKENSYEFCFDGIPKNSTVAISTNGCIGNKLDKYYFKKGFDKMIETVKPKTIVVYSNMPKDIFKEIYTKDIAFVNIPNYHYTKKRGVM